MSQNVGGAAATGFLGGAGIGASIGGSVIPGVGTVLGAVIGGGIGAFSGANKAKDVNAGLDMLMAVPAIDPTMTGFKDQLYREKRAVESGFSTDFHVARDIIGKSEAGGMSVAAEMAMTNPAMALMAMSQVGSGVDTSINKALGTIGTKGMGYTQMISDLIDKQSNRSLQVGIMKATQQLGMATKSMNDFNSNMNAGATQLLGMDWSSIIGGLGGNSGGAGMGSFTGANPVNFSTDPAVLAANPIKI